MEAWCAYLDGNHLVMKDGGTEQWELATKGDVTNVKLQLNVFKTNTQLKINSPNLELAK